MEILGTLIFKSQDEEIKTKQTSNKNIDRLISEVEEKY